MQKFLSSQKRSEDLSKEILKCFLIKSESCIIDFKGVDSLSTEYIRDFVLQLVIQLGTNAIKKSLSFENLTNELSSIYEKAVYDNPIYLDRRTQFSIEKNSFGDTTSLNRELLFKCRELSRRDPVSAKQLYGLDDTMIALFKVIELKKIDELACTGLLCFKPRFTEQNLKPDIKSVDTNKLSLLLNIAGSTDASEEIFNRTFA
ncbi:hypothetical protein [Methylomonas sp. AM2-LC]|uniref:hypothetical protein n=1 Tax=Methylomonas sp. AM2-LC TaxID=3153301 RepID=UPI00326582B6